MHEQQRDPAEQAAQAQAKLSDLGSPEPLVVGPSGTTRGPEDLGRGLFIVGGHETRLVPPVDWKQDPYASRSWRYDLHSFTWMRRAVAHHAQSGDGQTLVAARDVLLDWCATHLRGSGERQSEFAWYDMAVGLRAPYVAYVLRAGAVEGLLDSGGVDLLWAAAERHGEHLATPANYAEAHNHGLFQDEGLYLLSRQLPCLPRAEEWAELATERLGRTLRATVAFDEGAHLEHSSAYQFVITNMVKRLTEHVLELPWLTDLLTRLQYTACWHVTPGGRLAQLGDTDHVPAPRWAASGGAALRGLNALFVAGLAFVRRGDSYLAVTAGYHGPAHKHADDTGFILLENGHTIIGDPGRWGYYEDEPDRVYARSNRAHNVLVVDGEPSPWQASEPYGSGLEAAGEGDGWYAIVVSNPLLTAQAVAHRRMFLYCPGKALFVIDAVRADQEHEYSRYFHFGPTLDASLDGERVRLEASETGERIASVVGGFRRPGFALTRGQDKPEPVGWTFPGDRQRIPSWTAVVCSRDRDATYVAAFAIRAEPLAVAKAELDDDRGQIVLTDSSCVEIEIEDTKIGVMARGFA